MNDFEKWSYGLLEQDQTWWGKRIIENAHTVASGKYGEVLKEWRASDGWGDGVKVPHFIVFDGRKPRLLKANESGVFEKCDSGGWATARV